MTLTQQKAAKLLGVTPRTLRTWAKKGKGPKFTKKNVRHYEYKSVDIAAWQETIGNKATD